MNLQKLFEAQAVLDADIEKHHPIQDGEDRLSKKILALLVELGECANEWRGFKFWSNDQDPRVHVGIPKSYWYEGFLVVPVEPTKGQIYEYRNNLLEEYVDCLHFILSIGNEMKFEANQSIKMINAHTDWILESRDVKNTSITEQFIIVFNEIIVFEQMRGSDDFYSMLSEFFILGEKLGLTDKQIEQAYFVKNKINHQRQESGY